MNKFLLFFYLIIAANVNAQELHSEKLNNIFNSFFNSNEPGCAVAVVKNNEIVYRSSFGLAVLEHNIPINSKTVFEVGSVAKQFTGYGIALLVGQKKLNLKDDIRKHIPELPDYGTKISIDDLIHHKSGLMDQYALLVYSGYRDGDIITKDDVMNAILSERQLDFFPGEHYTYSNSNYRLLAEIIERVSQQPFAEFMNVNIFFPLKMFNTQFVENCDQVITNSAASYYSLNDAIYNKYAFNTCTIGSSGIWSTVEDMALWLKNFEKIKSENLSLFKLIQTGSKLNDGTPVHYGFGLEIDTFGNKKLLYHNGVNAGFNSQLYHFPDQALGIVILSNNDNFDYDLANRVASVFLNDSSNPQNIIVGTEEIIETASPQKSISLSTNEMRNYLGEFILNNGKYISFKILNNKFYRSMEGQPDTELLPQSETNFYYKDREFLEIEFKKDGNEKVNYFDLYSNGNIVQKGNRLLTESKQELEKYLGTYSHDVLNIVVSIFIKKGQLMIKHFKYGSSKLSFSSEKGLFIGTDFWLNSLEFIYDDNSNVISLKLLNPPNDRFNGVRLNKTPNKNKRH